MGALPVDAIHALLSRYGLEFVLLAEGDAIRGSFWGEPEAGIVGHTVYARPDTPLHSLLHETAHIICMSAERRDGLDRDAGADDLEEAAVCYLQVLLGEALPGTGGGRLMADMDAWGYSFRLGSTAAWFSSDADDARAYLVEHGLVTPEGDLTWRLRGERDAPI